MSFSFLDAIVNELTPVVAKNINLHDLKGSESYIEEIVSRKSPSMIIENKSNGIVVELKRVHCEFKTVIKHLQTHEPVFLTGPAGSGKSTIAEQCAEALSVKFSAISVCAQTTKTDFLGYRDANGHYVSTLFRDIYENGGVYLIDEIDAGNPNVLAVLNAALSTSIFAFPDKMVKRHDDFLLIATANTLGKGSTEYVGRNQLDAATLDRFNFIHVDYDHKLETALLPKIHKHFYEKFIKMRTFINSNKLPVIASTRSLLKIIKLIDIGLSLKNAIQSTILKTADEALSSKVLATIGE